MTKQKNKGQNVDVSDLEYTVSGCLLGSVMVDKNTITALVPNPNYYLKAEELGNGVVGLYVGKENKICKQLPVPRTISLPEGTRKVVYLGKPTKETLPTYTSLPIFEDDE